MQAYVQRGSERFKSTLSGYGCGNGEKTGLAWGRSVRPSCGPRGLARTDLLWNPPHTCFLPLTPCTPTSRLTPHSSCTRAAQPRAMPRGQARLLGPRSMALLLTACGPTAELASGGCNSHSVLGIGHSTAVGKSPTLVPTLATPRCACLLFLPQLSLGVRLHIPPCSQRLPLVPCFCGSTPVRTCMLHRRGLWRAPPPKPPRAV